MPQNTDTMEAMINVSTQQIDALVEWLGPRLEPLISHGANVRRILDATKKPDDILASAINVVGSDEGATTGPSLAPEEIAVWKAILPLLAEQGLLAIKGAGSALHADDKPLSKEEAAEYLGFSVSKLNRCLKKKQISYEKYGTGRTATVRFKRAELEKFRHSRNVPARLGHPQP
jgi:excisionase family DNA binding protein